MRDLKRIYLTLILLVIFVACSKNDDTTDVGYSDYIDIVKNYTGEKNLLGDDEFYIKFIKKNENLSKIKLYGNAMFANEDNPLEVDMENVDEKDSTMYIANNEDELIFILEDIMGDKLAEIVINLEKEKQKNVEFQIIAKEELSVFQIYNAEYSFENIEGNKIVIYAKNEKIKEEQIDSNSGEFQFVVSTMTETVKIVIYNEEEKEEWVYPNFRIQ
jgi:hypothetical protein